MQVRLEAETDQAAVRTVNESAFPTPFEACLVAELRRVVRPIVSLVAEDDGTVVGHILFSPVVLTGHEKLRIMSLGPMAVAPGYQRRGIGSALVRAGLERCRKLGFGAVAVVGHPDYYPRFGFSKAADFGVSCEFEVPEEAFLLIELQPGFLAGVSGEIQYHEAFRSTQS